MHMFKGHAKQQGFVYNVSLKCQDRYSPKKNIIFSLNFVFMNYELSLEQNWGYVNIAERHILVLRKFLNFTNMVFSTDLNFSGTEYEKHDYSCYFRWDV